MRYNRFGSTGLVVSEMCLGAMTFGNRKGAGMVQHDLDREGSASLVKQALDAGVNFIDTADVYTGGQSEEFVGHALRDLGIARDQVVVATKGMGPVGSGANDGGSGRYHMLNQIDASLARLQLDHVDLYQIHGWDPYCGLEEQLRAMEDIVRSGRARYIGISNWAAWHITKALGVQERKAWDRLVSVQAFYAVCSRELERDLVPMIESEGMGLMIWSPLAGGLLSGKYARGSDGSVQGEGRRASFAFPKVKEDLAFACVDAMRPMAEGRGVAIAAIALAWLLHQPVVSSVIVGAKRADQLEQNLAASQIELSADELDTLDAIAAPDVEYPHWAINGQPDRQGFRLTPSRGQN